jgi:hypothetical protein
MGQSDFCALIGARWLSPLKHLGKSRDIGMGLLLAPAMPAPRAARITQQFRLAAMLTSCAAMNLAAHTAGDGRYQQEKHRRCAVKSYRVPAAFSAANPALWRRAAGVSV